MFGKKNIIEKVKIYFKTLGIIEKDGMLKKITNNKISIMREFDVFWINKIRKDSFEELEISELKYLFKKETNKNLSEEEIKELLCYNYNIELFKDKKIIGYGSKQWDKKKSIKTALKVCFKEIYSDHVELYKQYCKCLKEQEDELIVSKSYFLKNIKNLINDFLKNSE